MKNLFNQIFNRLYKDKNSNKLIIGRWKRDYDTNILERKVYLANMDNCGCCENIKKNKVKINSIDNDDHLIPYLL
jgi:hypothetical protein